MTKGARPEKVIPVGAVLTLPVTGSEWDNTFVVSRRKTHEKLGLLTPLTYPSFSLLDPLYTKTLPLKQIRNGLFDAMTHAMDQVLTPHVLPMMDNFFYSVMRELVDISDRLIKNDDPTNEYHERLIVAASFAINQAFCLGKDVCWGIHQIGHMLTAKYGIDHGATLSIVAPWFLEEFVNERKYTMARATERVFDVHAGTDLEKAKAFIQKLREWINKIGQFTKVSDQSGAVIGKDDVNIVTDMVVNSICGNNFGYHRTVTKAHVQKILTKIYAQEN